MKQNARKSWHEPLSVNTRSIRHFILPPHLHPGGASVKSFTCFPDQQPKHTRVAQTDLSVFLPQLGQSDLLPQVETFLCPPSLRWGCLCSLGNQRFKNTEKQPAPQSLEDAIDSLIKSHKGRISVSEVMYDGVKPIPSHFCALWGFNRSVLISHY